MVDFIGQYLLNAELITPTGTELVCLSVGGVTKVCLASGFAGAYLPIAGGTMHGTIVGNDTGPVLKDYLGNVLISVAGQFYYVSPGGCLTTDVSLHYPGPGDGSDGPVLCDHNAIYYPDGTYELADIYGIYSPAGNTIVNADGTMNLATPIHDANANVASPGQALVGRTGDGFPVWGATPIPDGTYTVGGPLTPGFGLPGTITTVNGIITSIQQAT